VAESEAEPEDSEAVEEPEAAPQAVIDLAAGARYRATGKRKTAVARVILKPGTGAYLVNGKDLNTYFPRDVLQRTIRQPLETVGFEDRMDVIASLHGGVAGRRAAPRRLAGAPGGRPEPPWRAQTARLPHTRRSRQGTQEGRPQEGP